MSDRKDCRLSSITHTELADDRAHMAFDGFSRDEKGLRDSFIGKPSDNCIEDLSLPFCELTVDDRGIVELLCISRQITYISWVVDPAFECRQ